MSIPLILLMMTISPNNPWCITALPHPFDGWENRGLEWFSKVSAILESQSSGDRDPGIVCAWALLLSGVKVLTVWGDDARECRMAVCLNTWGLQPHPGETMSPWTVFLSPAFLNPLCTSSWPSKCLTFPPPMLHLNLKVMLERMKAVYVSACIHAWYIIRILS